MPGYELKEFGASSAYTARPVTYGKCRTLQELSLKLESVGALSPILR